MSKTMTTDPSPSFSWLPQALFAMASAIGSWLIAWRTSASKFEGTIQGKAEAEVQVAAAETAMRNKLEVFQSQRDDALRRDLADLKEDFRSAMQELRKGGELQASQNVVNQVTAKAIEAIVIKQDAHAEKLADHGSAIKLLGESMTMLRQLFEQERQSR